MKRPWSAAMVVMFVAVVIAGASAGSMSAEAADAHDLVILNGRVMDPETNFDGVRNVGIKDGKIVTITEDKIKGKETIDAKGHVVAPGFIDTHVHVVDLPFGQKLMLRDGVTTPLDLEVGAYPVDRFYDTLKAVPRPITVRLFRPWASVRRSSTPSTTPTTGIFTTDIYVKNEHSFVDMKWSATVPTDDRSSRSISWSKRVSNRAR